MLRELEFDALYKVSVSGAVQTLVVAEWPTYLQVWSIFFKVFFNNHVSFQRDTNSWLIIPYFLHKQWAKRLKYKCKEIWDISSLLPTFLYSSKKLMSESLLFGSSVGSTWVWVCVLFIYLFIYLFDLYMCLHHHKSGYRDRHALNTLPAM